MTSQESRPGWGAYRALVGPFLATLAEMIAGPFHLVAFLFKRKEVCRDIRRLLEQQDRDGSPP